MKNLIKKNYKDTLEFYNKLSVKYVKSISKAIPIERNNFIKNLPNGAHILDVGCAGGRDSKEFINKGFKVTGIDFSESLIKIARKALPQAKFIKMNVLNIKFPAKSFDAIWAQAVLLHLEKSDMLKVMKKYYKILKKGGILHVAVKQGKGTNLLKDQQSGLQRFYTYFSKKEMENFFKKSGFKIIYSKNLPPVAVSEPNVEWIAIMGKK